jgi:regulatory protein
MKDIVTEIRELKNGVRVAVNDRIALRMTRKNLRSLSLAEGDAVDIRELKQQLLLEQYPEALNRAVRLLALRARSRFEMENRLADACYLEDTVEMVLTKLRTEGLLDDRAFAAQWARDRTARQIGRARILHELRQKGIDGALAEQALSELDPQRQDESAAHLAAKLMRRNRNFSAEDAQRKTILAMRRRGYTYGEARKALDAIKRDS